MIPKEAREMLQKYRPLRRLKLRNMRTRSSMALYKDRTVAIYAARERGQLAKFSFGWFLAID